ncbi:MAG TPA: hypothetical protein P5275_16700 [Saprospiraceae bacterium]|nr:hypothetical protein [Saprospiraceae bacterium]HRV86515.1 hypothetical protein [Saprospiraceae bacterium]
MHRHFFWIAVIPLLIGACTENNPPSLQFAITLQDTGSTHPLDGRLLLMISTDSTVEPRYQIVDGSATQQVYGMDIEDINSGSAVNFDPLAYGYPIQSMSDLPEGDYWVQALLHKYETFTRSDGHTVKMPMDRGEGQQWNLAPGNLYSVPQKVHIQPGKAIQVVADQIIPPLPEPQESKYIKYVRIQSKLLTEFWGRPMFLGAFVLLPEGFDTHPDVRYPLAIFHGHFPSELSGFRETPPDPDLQPDYSERFHISGYNRIQQEEAYRFYKLWTGPDFPRVLAIEIQHANPFYDDSYAVNSENLGPYGDALTYELIPYIEQEYRGIGEGWARFTYGGSTGGWEALAVQVKYPTEYNGCYAACPDPIDFRAYTVVNLYDDANAYYIEGPFRNTPRPGHRDYLGHVQAMLKDMNFRELALGTKSRSGQQWDIWEAVFSPVGDDGYPKRIWDKASGVIDKDVAAYWKENYDLSYIMQRDWSKNGKDWEGKIHIYCGDMDNYYLNDAVYLAEDRLKATKEPFYDGQVDYGDRAEHCWNGDHTQPNYISRLRYHEMYINKWVQEVGKRVPEDADLRSWRY